MKIFTIKDFDEIFFKALGLSGVDARVEACEVYFKEKKSNFFFALGDVREDYLKKVNPPFEPDKSGMEDLLDPIDDDDDEIVYDEAAEDESRESHFRLDVLILADKYNNEITSLVYRAVPRERAVALVEAMKGLDDHSMSPRYGSATMALLPAFEEGLTWGEFAKKWNSFNPECEEIPVPTLEFC